MAGFTGLWRPSNPNIIHYNPKDVVPYTPQPSKELVGAKNFVLCHSEAEGSIAGMLITGAGSFTVVTFDTTFRADAAKILLKNDFATTYAILACAIKGQPVYRLSGENGFIHDKYINYESIAVDGDKLFELENNMICTLVQVNKLADIHWKRNKTKKHIYTVTIPGFHSYFEPGEWYTLQVGSVGLKEYINSTVECYAIRLNLSAGDIGSTSIDFREVQQNWVFDSNENARFVASGGYNRKPTSKVVTVAASTYVGDADYYCDGTDDDVEINIAINTIYVQGGGTVQLTEGTFNQTNYINLENSVKLQGMGQSTILTITGATISLSSVGTAGTHRSYCTVENICFNDPHQISFDYSDFATIKNLYIIGDMTASNDWIISVENSDSCLIMNNYIDAQGNICDIYGFIFVNTSSNVIISNNILKGLRTIWLLYGIFIDNPCSLIQINNNCLSDFSTSGAVSTQGITVGGSYCLISNNKIEQLKNSNTASLVRAIEISTGAISNSVISNYCYDNGTDTGIGNENKCNFFDAGVDTQFSG